MFFQVETFSQQDDIAQIFFGRIQFMPQFFAGLAKGGIIRTHRPDHRVSINVHYSDQDENDPYRNVKHEHV